MIIEPNLSDLMKNEEFDSRYTLVVAAAKRAREISGDNPAVDKAVKAAVCEIAEGKVHVIPAPEVEEIPEEEIVYKDFTDTLDNGADE